MADQVVPALAAAVSVVFAALVARQWVQRRRPHQAAWALGLLAYAAASALEAVYAEGWTVRAYRAYFPLGAAPVGLLGLGTLHLLGAPRWANLFAITVALALIVCSSGVLAQRLDPALLDEGATVGAKPVPLPNPARWAFLYLNVVGGLALVGGALASWWRTRSHGVLLIGLGALLAASGGALASLRIFDDRLMLQLLAVCLMFAGYLRSREAPPRAAQASSAS